MELEARKIETGIGALDLLELLLGLLHVLGAAGGRASVRMPSLQQVTDQESSAEFAKIKRKEKTEQFQSWNRATLGTNQAMFNEYGDDRTDQIRQ